MEIQEHSYSRGIVNKRIAILGIYPPPFGGVAVHIQRVADQFVAQGNQVHIFKTERWLRRVLFPFYLITLLIWVLTRRPHYIYYHSSYLNFSIVELLMLSLVKPLLRCAITVVDHDCRHLYKRSARYKRWYNWLLHNKGYSLVCIGESTWKSYKENSIEPSSCAVEQAFLPPSAATAHLVLQTYPSSLSIFMKDHTPLIALSAAHALLLQGKDVYGLDLSIDMLARIRGQYPDAGLIIGLPQVLNENYFERVQHRMRQKGVAEQIYILHGNKEFWPLLQKVDLFVRPTLSDGDSISIREALYFQVPVVASDVVQRPTGTYCFKTGDVAAFAVVVNKVLEQYVYGVKMCREKKIRHDAGGDTRGRLP